MSKKMLLFALTGVMLVSLMGGCAKSSKTIGGSNEKEHYKFTITTMNAEREPSEMYKYMTNKFNVDFEFIPITSNDWSEKIRIWMATGDMPDIMKADIQNYNMNEYRSWVEQGLIKELPDFSNYPNLKAANEQLASAKYFNIDGKNYAWAAPRDGSINDFISPYCFFYRYDWAEKLGMAKDEYTWDEFLKLAKAFKEKDPGNLGASKTIALTGISNAFPHFAGLMQFSPYWEQYVLEDGKYVWGMDKEETLQGILMAKKMYDEGILWEDQILAKNEDGVNKFNVGEAGITFKSWVPTNIKLTRESLKKMHPDLDVNNAVRPMYVKAPNGKLWGQKTIDYWSICVFNKNLDDKKMSRIMTIFDWLLSDEGIEMTKNGIKDIDYNMIDGKVIKTEVSKNKVNPISGSIVRNATFDYESDDIPEADRKTGLEILDRLKKDETALRQYDLDLYFYSAENKNKYGSFYEEGKEKIKQIITSSKNVEKDWNEWKDSVRPRVNLVLEELNSK